jgi:hypothetical protein
MPVAASPSAVPAGVARRSDCTGARYEGAAVRREGSAISCGGCEVAARRDGRETGTAAKVAAACHGVAAEASTAHVAGESATTHVAAHSTATHGVSTAAAAATAASAAKGEACRRCHRHQRQR